MRGLASAVHALDNEVTVETQTAMLLDARKLVERSTRWLLRHRRGPIDIAAEIEFFAPAPGALLERFPDLLVAAERKAFERGARRLVDAGVPDDLARRVAAFDPLYSVFDISEVASRAGEAVEPVAAVYYLLGDRLQLHWLRDQVNALPRDSRWQTLARAALRDDLYAQHRELTAKVLAAAGPDREPKARIEAWQASAGPAMGRARQVLADVKSSGVFDLATLSVCPARGRRLRHRLKTTPAWSVSRRTGSGCRVRHRRRRRRPPRTRRLASAASPAHSATVSPAPSAISSAPPT